MGYLIQKKGFRKGVRCKKCGQVDVPSRMIQGLCRICYENESAIQTRLDDIRGGKKWNVMK